MKSGVATSVVIDAAYIQSILPAGLAWAYPYLPFMHGLNIGDIPTFCSVDPPTWTVPSGADIYAFLTGGPLSQVDVVDTFLQNVTRAYLWYNFCECKSVATPAPPSAPSAPSNLPAINPPGTVGVQPAVCATNSATVSINANVQPGREVLHNVGVGSVGNVNENTLITPLPAGVRQVQVTTAFEGPGVESSGTIPSWDTQINFWNGTSFVSQARPTNQLSGVDSHLGSVKQSGLITVPSSATGYTLAVYLDTHSQAIVTDTVNFYCQTAPNVGGAQGCCTASDPVTVATLSRIYQLLTLIQRQSTPFAYISGTAHHSLTGSGTISVQGILGVLLNVSVPSRAGELVGTPDTFFDLGWINFGTADGYEDRRPIRGDSQLVFPTLQGIWTLVGYTLLPGVTMTLTELIRES